MPRPASTAVALSLLIAVGGCYLSHTPAEPPPPTDCDAALLFGAPAPMPGYCPTLANRAAFTMPDAAPELRWTLELPGEPPTYAAMAVAPRGRIYVQAGTQLLAVDDRGSSGSVAFATDLERPITAPVLLADGTIFVVVRGADGSEGVWLRDDGTIASRAALPGLIGGHPLVGHDGDLYFHVRRDAESTAIVALAGGGSSRWSRELGAAYPTLALDPREGSDGVVVAEGRPMEDLSGSREGYYRIEVWVTSLDGATGEPRFASLVEDDSSIAAGPAIGPDGAVYLVVWSDGFESTTLVVLDPRDGAERLRVPLLTPTLGGGPFSLSVAHDGTAYVKAGTTFVAVGPDGTRRWEHEVHLNFDLGGTIDGSDRLLVSHSSVDGDTGSEIWVSDIPVYSEPTPSGGISFTFPGTPIIGDGALYYMAAESILYAAGPRE